MRGREEGCGCDTCAPPPSSDRAGRRGLPEPVRARREGKEGGTRPAQGGGSHLGARARGGARTRAAHLLAGAPGPARPPPGVPGPAGARAAGTVRAEGIGVAAARGPGLTMAELLRSLQDSQLVARFQRRCGLFPAPEEGPPENGADPAEDAARALGLGHLSDANGKGGGGPANGLRRVSAPQVTAARCSPRWGRGQPADVLGLQTPRRGDPRAPSQAATRLPAPGMGGRGGSGHQDATSEAARSQPGLFRHQML